MITYTKRQREALERMTPEQRAMVEGRRAENETPERGAEDRATHEYYQTRRPTWEELAAEEDEVPFLWELFQALITLKKLRTAKGLTATEIARRAKIDPGALSRLESGKNANPTFETLSRYAAAIGASLTIEVQDLDAPEADPKIFNSGVARGRDT
jgi:DNA-binding Xre family transcriptional regulator